MTDTHAHLYLSDYSADIEQVMHRCRQENIANIFLPAIDNREHENLLLLAARYPDICKPMMGMHPCSVKEDYENELANVYAYLKKFRFWGIGETGLDYYWDLSFKEQQRIAFEQQIVWAKEFNLPVIIHSRNSIDDCIELVEKHQDGSLRGVFHCFTGTIEQAKRISDLDFFMGIGGVITYKKSGLDLTVKSIPRELLVLETDAPYLSPVPFRGKRNESSYLPHIALAVARALELPVGELEKITDANAQRLFGSY